MERRQTHKSISAAGRAEKTENAREGGTRHQSSCVYANMCVCMCVCVRACVCRAGMKEREGQRLKERKVGGSVRGKRKRGGDIFSLFSCSHFL